MGYITLEQRSYIIEKHEEGLPFVYIAEHLGFTPQEITCVYLYKDIPEKDFLEIRDGDIHSMTIAHVVQNSDYTRDEARQHLREYTASELITGKMIKIDKSKNYGHVNMNSSVM